jgi:hypothetical protein
VFYLGTRRLPVVAILDRWHDASHRYFEVKADDGRCFLLRHAPATDHWELAGVYRAHKPLRPRVAAIRAERARRPARLIKIGVWPRLPTTFSRCSRRAAWRSSAPPSARAR